MIINRKWVTPLVAGAFILSAATGVLIFFHVDSGANKFVHEWLSWALLGGVILHGVNNFGAIKGHLKARQGQLIIAAFVLVLAVSFIPLGGNGKPPFATSVAALANSPWDTLAEVAAITPDELKQRLAAAGVHPQAEQQRLSDITGEDLGRQMRVLNSVLAGSGNTR